MFLKLAAVGSRHRLANRYSNVPTSHHIRLSPIRCFYFTFHPKINDDDNSTYIRNLITRLLIPFGGGSNYERNLSKVHIRTT